MQRAARRTASRRSCWRRPRRSRRSRSRSAISTRATRARVPVRRAGTRRVLLRRHTTEDARRAYMSARCRTDPTSDRVRRAGSGLSARRGHPHAATTRPTALPRCGRRVSTVRDDGMAERPAARLRALARLRQPQARRRDASLSDLARRELGDRPRAAPGRSCSSPGQPLAEDRGNARLIEVQYRDEPTARGSSARAGRDAARLARRRPRRAEPDGRERHDPGGRRLRAGVLSLGPHPRRPRDRWLRPPQGARALASSSTSSSTTSSSTGSSRRSR